MKINNNYPGEISYKIEREDIMGMCKKEGLELLKKKL